MINVASRLPTALLIRDTDEEGAPTNVTFEIAGNRDLNGVAGCGITYGVDDAVFNKWLAANPDQAPFLKAVTDEDILKMSDAANLYGYELGLEETTAAPQPGDAVYIGDGEPESPLQRLQAAAVQLRESELGFRQAETLAKNAEAGRVAAEEARKEAHERFTAIEKDAEAAMAAAPVKPPPAKPARAASTTHPPAPAHEPAHPTKASQ